MRHKSCRLAISIIAHILQYFISLYITNWRSVVTLQWRCTTPIWIAMVTRKVP